MMIDFQHMELEEASPTEVVEEVPEPSVSVIESDGRYGKFSAEPLPEGHGITLGNPLRRILYGSLNGTAITWVKIEDVLHEYTTIPHVKEEVSEFLLNVKGIRLRSQVDRPGKLRLEVTGQGEVSAGDIMASADFEVVNPELHLATLDAEDARLSVEFNVERGRGYEEAAQGNGLPIGVLPVDAIYTPVRKVNYKVERMRVGQRTNLERLILEIWTDGSIAPVEALREAANILVARFFLFANARLDSDEEGVGLPLPPQVSPEQYNTTVERLELSSRTLNCLKRAGINMVGEVLALKKSELLQIKNFGEKSLNELYDKLREMDLLPKEFDPDFEPPKAEEIPDGEENLSAEDLDEVEPVGLAVPAVEE
jgi:DNA-directed RNA polymerase subunit alpha